MNANRRVKGARLSMERVFGVGGGIRHYGRAVEAGRWKFVSFTTRKDRTLHSPYRLWLRPPVEYAKESEVSSEVNAAEIEQYVRAHHAASVASTKGLAEDVGRALSAHRVAERRLMGEVSKLRRLLSSNPGARQKRFQIAGPAGQTRRGSRTLAGSNSNGVDTEVPGCSAVRVVALSERIPEPLWDAT